MADRKRRRESRKHAQRQDTAEAGQSMIDNRSRDSFRRVLLTQNPHLAPSTQQAEQAGFTREEITRRASQFSLKN
jgi:hypothetical protein